MTSPRQVYEFLLTEYSHHEAAISLLQQYRPYVEMVPSIRRSQDSLMALPLPIIKVRRLASPECQQFPTIHKSASSCLLPCDLAYLLCDPEWKIKMGGEIIVMIHRPDEHFSDLLNRWRQTQVLLDSDYEWVMPNYYQQLITEGSDRIYPLFVLNSSSDDRIKQGLINGHLPFVVIQTNILESID